MAERNGVNPPKIRPTPWLSSPYCTLLPSCISSSLHLMRHQLWSVILIPFSRLFKLGFGPPPSPDLVSNPGSCVTPPPIESPPLLSPPPYFVPPLALWSSLLKLVPP